MAKSGIKLEFKGFDEMIEKIRKAELDVKPIVDDCMQNAAKIQQKELERAMTETGVDKGLIERMPKPKVDWQGDKCRAIVGYPVDNYNPNNLSDAFKVIFRNYGTPKYEGKHFIATAKKAAAPQIRKETKKTLKQIIKEIEK
jgi:HK97 gp10 family phage protein